ncbi:hypothetical protein CK203_024533 [Vitis vinifera]|uniref:Uncharacterized protein n=1 Tax=Vitis vinifera TaxID=29760 RepID=A0A438IUK5_VITVI|nr:hypothetical protein CK203_024533 [Vitis vinifera]
MSSSIKLDMDEKGFSLWSVFSLCTRASRSVQLHLCASKASGWWLLLPLCFHSRFAFLLFLFIGWHQAERRALPGLRASALLSHLSPSKRSSRKARFDMHSSVRMKTISATSKNLPRGKSSQGEVSISPNFSTSGLRGYSDGWDGYPL